MEMKLNRLIIILCFCINTALPYTLNLGTYVPGFMSYQDDSSGGTKKFEFNPYISAALPMPAPFLSDYYFVPEIGFVYHMNTTDDIKKYTFFLLYPLATKFNEIILLRFGFATFMDRITGNGSAKNYNGTYYTPDSSATTYTGAILLGSEFLLFTSASLRFDLFINRFLSSERRNYSYLLSYSMFY